jgi:transcriptional regulator with XRE-family HTH domain
MISLDKIAKTNIFKVPNNYFEELTLSIKQLIEIQEKPNFGLISKKPFSMPEGYFEGLSSKILSKIEQIKQKSIDLESLKRINIFKVPSNYFENSDERIQANVWIESLEKQNVFQVPDNYFQELEINIGIEKFDNVNVFKVPKGYFETLTERILSNTSSKKEAKTIKINWLSARIKWSAAASIVLMVGLWFGVPQFTKDKTALALEKVSNEEIKTYLETQDLSYLEYESAVENANNNQKANNDKVLEGLKIDKQDILDHLENQDLEEDI